MISFPNCTLQQAAEHGARLSTFFDTEILNQPHSLAFEKVLFPCAFYRKKMYAAMKYEEYEEGAKGKIFARGLSAVRRDNALLVKDTVLSVMDLMFKQRKPADEIVDFCGKALANIHNSALTIHSTQRTWSGKLAFDHFVQSAGISKELDDYDADNSATVIAKQMLELNPQCGVGKASRVTFVITKKPVGKTKRCEQVLLPDLCLKKRIPLDHTFYVDAVVAKIAPLLSVFFMNAERKQRQNKTMDGGNVELVKTKAAGARLLGEATAERSVLSKYREQRLVADAVYVEHDEDEGHASKKQKTITGFFKQT